MGTVESPEELCDSVIAGEKFQFRDILGFHGCGNVDCGFVVCEVVYSCGVLRTRRWFTLCQRSHLIGAVNCFTGRPLCTFKNAPRTAIFPSSVRQGWKFPAHKNVDGIKCPVSCFEPCVARTDSRYAGISVIRKMQSEALWKFLITRYLLAGMKLLFCCVKTENEFEQNNYEKLREYEVVFCAPRVEVLRRSSVWISESLPHTLRVFKIINCKNFTQLTES